MTLKLLLRYKAGKTIDSIEKYLGNNIIDVGAGRCMMSKEILSRNSFKRATCVDVIDVNETDLDLKIYDGETLPFCDNMFDTGLLLFTLHHCDNPIKVLEETMRVCKNNVIFIEHTDSFFVRQWDFFTNKILHFGIECPFNFKSVKEWGSIIENHNWKLIHYEKGAGAEFVKPLVRNHLFIIGK